MTRQARDAPGAEEAIRMSAAPVGYRPVATLDDAARGAFIVRVYQHLLLAIGAFVLFEALLINLGVAEAMWDFFASRARPGCSSSVGS